MSTDTYFVSVEDFAERHYVTSFKKKYHGAWEVTLRGIKEELVRIRHILGKSNRIEIIVDQKPLKLIKVDFRVHGTTMSAKSSGNRYVAVLNDETGTAKILLVYSKNDVRGNHETVWWQGVVKSNYPEYRALI
jgi:hypothetical protein